MQTFSIRYNNSDIPVTKQGKGHYTVQLPGRDMQLLVKQDNEGAEHWFEEGTDNETEESKAFGIAIETYLMQHEGEVL